MPGPSTVPETSRGTRMAQSTLRRTDQHNGQSAEEMTGQHFVRRGDLDLDAGIEHQERLRTFQHVAWAVLALLVVLAFLGAFGGGPLSKATATRDGEPIQVAYERVGHRQSQFHPVKLPLPVGDGAFQDGQSGVYITRTYLDALQLQSMNPLPDSQEPAPGGTVYVFSGNGPAEVTITLQAAKMGVQKAEIGLMNGEELRTPVTFSQFIYP